VARTGQSEFVGRARQCDRRSRDPRIDRPDPLALEFAADWRGAISSACRGRKDRTLAREASADPAILAERKVQDLQGAGKL
jgi:hypothetical protein